MQMEVSRSEKKRQAARVEKLAGELAALSAGEIKSLPVAEPLRQEILAIDQLNAGARKRQVKFIAKELRRNEEECRRLAEFLARRKGSKLKENEEFHQLEQLRQTIISEAITAFEAAREQEEPMPAHWPSPALEEAQRLLPALDPREIRGFAARYARSRKTTHSREIFRYLKGLQEKQKLPAAPPGGTDDAPPE